ncbi:MAG: hypothetical protein IPJ07_08965 [Acidobacteria bacterium]|nr:hypothetical protein [Acidobacteriota bacterium]
MDNQFPYHVYGAQQDRGTVAGAVANYGLDNSTVTGSRSAQAKKRRLHSARPCQSGHRTGQHWRRDPFRFDRRTWAGAGWDANAAVAGQCEIILTPDDGAHIRSTGPACFYQGS